MLSRVYEEIGPILGELMNDLAENSDSIQDILCCVSILLKKVIIPSNLWPSENRLGQRCFQGLLVFSVDERQKVRNKAMKCIENCLAFYQTSEESDALSPTESPLPSIVRNLVRAFIRREVEASSKDPYSKTFAFICDLVSSLWSYLTLKECSQIMQMLLNCTLSRENRSSNSPAANEKQTSLLKLMGSFAKDFNFYMQETDNMKSLIQSFGAFPLPFPRKKNKKLC